MTTELFAGLPVSNFSSAVGWYERLFGVAASFYPHETEAVWELGEHRFAYIVELPDRAGGGLLTMIVADLDARIEGIAERGLEPADQETYDNGVQKVTYRDPDGNEIGFGSVPAE
jgi:hypothetical protein